MGTVNAVTGSLLYLDANVFIYAVEDVTPHASRLRPVFQRIDRGELRGASSELSLAEVLVKPLRDGAHPVRSQ